MIWFPQTDSGSVAQFPLARARRWRAITNELESGERISIPDSRGGSIGWSLSYQDLTDTEMGRIQTLFTACGGSLTAFAFVDPMANLFGWSEDFTKPDWQAGQLQCAGGAGDPKGTMRAWSLANSSAAVQGLSQTVGIPGEYVSCFSVWVRSVAQCMVTLRRDSLTQTFATGPVWTAVRLAGTGIPGTSESTYSVEVAAACTVEVWGMQVEAQPWSSKYKTARVARGIYPGTYFATDELKVTSVAAGRSSCDVALISRS